MNAEYDYGLTLLLEEEGEVVTYRPAFVDSADAGPTGPDRPSQPVGARDPTDFDQTAALVTDSSVDANTGFVGSYAPSVVGPVHVLLINRANGATVNVTPFGIDLEEGEIAAVFLAYEVQPKLNDLIITDDNRRYVIGNTIVPYGKPGSPLLYISSVDYRVPSDPVYRTT